MHLSRYVNPTQQLVYRQYASVELNPPRVGAKSWVLNLRKISRSNQYIDLRQRLVANAYLTSSGRGRNNPALTNRNPDLLAKVLKNRHYYG